MAGLQFAIWLGKVVHIKIFNSRDHSGSSRSFRVLNLEQRDAAMIELFAWHGTLTAPATFECVVDQLRDICTRMKTEDPPPRRTAGWEFERGVCHARQTPVALPSGDLQAEGWDVRVFRQVLVPCAEGPRDIAAFKDGQGRHFADCSRMLVRFYFSDGSPPFDQLMIATRQSSRKGWSWLYAGSRNYIWDFSRFATKLAKVAELNHLDAVTVLTSDDFVWRTKQTFDYLYLNDENPRSLFAAVTGMTAKQACAQAVLQHILLGMAGGWLKAAALDMEDASGKKDAEGRVQISEMGIAGGGLPQTVAEAVAAAPDNERLFSKERDQSLDLGALKRTLTDALVFVHGGRDRANLQQMEVDGLVKEIIDELHLMRYALKQGAGGGGGPRDAAVRSCSTMVIVPLLTNELYEHGTGDCDQQVIAQASATHQASACTKLLPPCASQLLCLQRFLAWAFERYHVMGEIAELLRRAGGSPAMSSPVSSTASSTASSSGSIKKRKAPMPAQETSSRTGRVLNKPARLLE